MTPDELIQLMRLSGTGKVREFLIELHKSTYPSDIIFYDNLMVMFQECKRTTPDDAWPSPPPPPLQDAH